MFLMLKIVCLTCLVCQNRIQCVPGEFDDLNALEARNIFQICLGQAARNSGL